MKWNSLILSLVLSSGAVVAHPQMGMAQATKDNTEARRLWNEGNELFNDGNFTDAEKKFREALTKYPKTDQADRSAYYLIKTLEKLRRFQEARAEIENFHRNYPGSRWREDVDVESLALGASSNTFAQQQAKIDEERALSQKLGSTALPPNASLDAVILQMIILQNPNEGIAKAKERLKIDPSDQAVINNLGTIFSCNSPQALPFLLDLSNSAVSPATRNIAFFYAMRRNPDRVQVANTLMEMLKKKENESIVSEALFRMTYEEHRQVLMKIVTSPNPNKFDAIERIYRGGSITLRTDLLNAVATLKDDPKADSFIKDDGLNDKDLAVRQAAVTALQLKNGGNIQVLENLLGITTVKKIAPSTPSAPSTVAPAGGSAPALPPTPIQPASIRK
jgi:outer membrane protein assembly factor BamD (BamD/ComL family)